MVLLKQSMTPLKVTAAALSVLVHEISISLCHFLKSQITFTSPDPRALTVHPSSIVQRRCDHLTSVFSQNHLNEALASIANTVDFGEQLARYIC